MGKNSERVIVICVILYQKNLGSSLRTQNVRNPSQNFMRFPKYKDSYNKFATSSSSHRCLKTSQKGLLFFAFEMNQTLV